MSRKITRIEVQKRSPQRRSVYLDGTYAFALDQEAVGWFGLREGLELSDADVARLCGLHEREKAKNAALTFISTRMRSRKEVLDRLRQKGHPGPVIEGVISDLGRAGLIDDLKFARLWVEERSRSKSLGSMRLKQELRRRGVDQDVVDAVLEETLGDADQLSTAVQLAQQKIRQYSRLEPIRVRKRISDLLARRGFAYEVIEEALAEVMGTAEAEGG